MLRDYQRSQYKLTHKHQDNPIVIAHTGTGKGTLLAYELNQDKSRSLVIVPSHSLRNNIIDRYRTLYGEQTHFDVATYQSLKNTKAEYQNIFVDEAHITAAKSFTKILQNIQHDRLFGYTATPQRLDGKPLNMFNRIVPTESMRWFINKNYLADYSLLTVKGGSLRDELADSYSDRLELQQELLDTKAEIENAVELWREHAYGLKTFFFCSGQIHGLNLFNKFSESFPEFKFVYIDSKSSKDKVTQAIDDFRAGEITGIFNVDLLVLGVDCPDAQCCFLLRFTYSLTRYLQSIGRVLRHSPGKKAVILDPYGNCLEHGHPDMIREWSLTGRVKRSKDTCEHCSKCGLPVVEKDYAKKNAIDELYEVVCPNCLRLNIFQYPLVFRRRKKKKAELRSVELSVYGSEVTMGGLMMLNRIAAHPNMPIQIKRKLIISEKSASVEEKRVILLSIGDSIGLINQLLGVC